MDALDRFIEIADDIEVIRRRSAEITQLLIASRSEAEQQWKQAFAELDFAEKEKQPAAELLRLRENEQEQYAQRSFAEAELNIWQRETHRRTAIAYCTAFETFLRDFLIEQALLVVGLDAFLAGAVKKKVGLSVSVAVPPNPIDLDDYISKECRSFQNFDSVNQIYKQMLQKNPFNKLGPANSIFESEQARLDAYVDIQLLFCLRHQFVHSPSRPGRRYRSNLENIKGKGDYAYLLRLHTDLINKPLQPDERDISPVSSDTFESKMDETNKPRARYSITNPPPPDEIALSPAISNVFGSKIEEMTNSLLDYARYIGEVCAVKN
ncbi:hypothetical protein HUU39_05755 [candidate division KSB1 bacterium]|nr:hypothetical protein [bacterium]NUM64766.1 hypothetical protein [candidate division KSB1 bacterium]